MIGRRVVGGGGGELIGGAGSGDRSVAALTRVAGAVAAGRGVGARVTVGSLRTEDGTSGRGGQLRDQGLDLAPASATGPGEHGFVVLRCEVRTQHPDGGEGHRARGEGLEDDGKVSAGASRLDTVAGGVLGEPEHLRAVSEERTVAFGGEEGGSGVEHSQMRHELDRCLALLAGEHADAREEIVIRETGGESEDVRVHVRMCSTPISGA